MLSARRTVRKGNMMPESSRERPIDFRIFKDLDIPEFTIAKGNTILAEGGDGAIMFVVRSGTVEVQVNGITVETISEGGIFGEMALLDHATRSADIIAMTDVVAVPLDEKKFILLIAKVPHFSLLVMRSLARRIRKMNTKLAAG
jgi:CRP/FNR family transcriptional regulator, cyclic AMP receptor protein